jgi:hypothetical protein
VPAVQQAVNDAKDQAGPVVEEAKRRGSLAADALKGEPVKKKGGKKKFFLFAALAGAGALAFKKLRGSDESANWQSSYTPTPPAPAAPPAPASPSGPSRSTANERPERPPFMVSTGLPSQDKPSRSRRPVVPSTMRRRRQQHRR